MNRCFAATGAVLFFICAKIGKIEITAGHDKREEVCFKARIGILAVLINMFIFVIRIIIMDVMSSGRGIGRDSFFITSKKWLRLN
jgi:hypothetical protein